MKYTNPLKFALIVLAFIVVGLAVTATQSRISDTGVSSGSQLTKGYAITICGDYSCNYVIDGTADDIEIQTAINNAVYGDEIKIINTSVNITKTINISTDGISFILANAEISPVGINGGVLFNITGDDIKFRGGTFDLTNAGIDVNFMEVYGLNTEISNSIINNIPCAGILLYANETKVHNININNSGMNVSACTSYSLIVTTGSHISIYNNKFGKSGDNGIYCSFPSGTGYPDLITDIKIFDNSFSQYQGSTGHIKLKCSNAIVSNNYIDMSTAGSSPGIDITGYDDTRKTSNSKIIGNTIIGIQQGIFMGFTNHTLISGNTIITAGGKYSVYFEEENQTNTQIVNNYLYGGINPSATVIGLDITHNTFRLHGIEVAAGAQNISADNNKFEKGVTPLTGNLDYSWNNEGVINFMNKSIVLGSAGNFTFDSGAEIYSNITCLILKSPDGTGRVEVCNT